MKQNLMDRAWETQQQYEVHTGVVRVAIDVLNYEYNHDARRQSPRLSADRLQLSGDVGLDLETKKSSAPNARLSWLLITREYAAGSSQSSCWARMLG